MMSGKRDEV